MAEGGSSRGRRRKRELEPGETVSHGAIQLWHCPKLKATIRRSQCDTNREMVSEARRNRGRSPTAADYTSTRIHLAPCFECPGVAEIGTRVRVDVDALVRQRKHDLAQEAARCEGARTTAMIRVQGRPAAQTLDLLPDEILLSDAAARAGVTRPTMRTKMREMGYEGRKLGTSKVSPVAYRKSDFSRCFDALKRSRAERVMRGSLRARPLHGNNLGSGRSRIGQELRSRKARRPTPAPPR